MPREKTLNRKCRHVNTVTKIRAPGPRGKSKPNYILIEGHIPQCSGLSLLSTLLLVSIWYPAGYKIQRK